jgi:hypothetical protein
MQEEKINDIWLKAAILGSLWASFEIVMGNFVHSLKIPFGGQFMASISVILLISAFQIWKQKGLIIRAGIICALMKLLSPGIKIFGPMIGIFAEAALLELGILLFGKNIAGYMFGGGLAITWTLLQRIFNYLILYGMNLVILYNNIYEYALKSIPFSSGSPWIPIILLIFLYMIMGAIAGYMGYSLGKRSAGIKTGTNSEDIFIVKENPKIHNNMEFTNSYYKLIFLIVLTITYLALNPYLSIFVKLPAVIISGILIIFWYRTFIKKIIKPKFWIQIIIIAMLASYFIGGIKENDWGLNSGGMIAGIDMSLRAIFILLCFSGISLELKKPLAGLLLKSKKMKNLSGSVMLTFETLPFFISRISSDKTVFRHPVKALSRFISELDNWEKSAYNYINKTVIKSD